MDDGAEYYYYFRRDDNIFLRAMLRAGGVPEAELETRAKALRKQSEAANPYPRQNTQKALPVVYMSDVIRASWGMRRPVFRYDAWWRNDDDYYAEFFCNDRRLSKRDEVVTIEKEGHQSYYYNMVARRCLRLSSCVRAGDLMELERLLVINQTKTDQQYDAIAVCFWGNEAVSDYVKSRPILERISEQVMKLASARKVPVCFNLIPMERTPKKLRECHAFDLDLDKTSRYLLHLIIDNRTDEGAAVLTPQSLFVGKYRVACPDAVVDILDADK
jgi:hypothetical protein